MNSKSLEGTRDLFDPFNFLKTLQGILVSISESNDMPISSFFLDLNIYNPRKTKTKTQANNSPNKDVFVKESNIFFVI